MDQKTVEDFWLAGWVMSARMMRIGMGMGDAASTREAHRMVSEKMTAAAQGYVDLTVGLMTGDRNSWENPVETFVAPGRKTLHKNVRRLTGYRVRSSKAC